MNLKNYQAFVGTTISDASRDFPSMISRLCELQDNELDVAIPELLTAAVGLTAEAGEFDEIVKKLVFQGKPLNEENIHHMKRELGDVMWYLAVACRALGTSIDEILEMNVEKLSARYPAGFEILRSEVRVASDV